MPLLNFFFWFLLAAAACLIYGLLSWLRREEARDLANLARLYASQKQLEIKPVKPGPARQTMVFFDLGQPAGQANKKAAS